MPYFFKMTLGKKGKGVADDLLIELGLANLYGWIAYTIYDDFLDDEGDSILLSVANVCLRELTTIFNSILPNKTGFVSFFQQAMDKLDAANTWEVTNCRVNPEKLLTEKHRSLKIPDYHNYSKLAERSLGHALGPIAILFSFGFTEKSSEVKNLMKFFRHYLTARQLNDDAHDWEKDLRMGHINAVGAEILKKVQSSRQKGGQAKFKVKSNRQLQQIFWYEVVVGVCEAILKHIQLAKETLKANKIIADPILFEKILVLIEKSARKALKEREETIKFLKAYGK